MLDLSRHLSPVCLLSLTLDNTHGETTSWFFQKLYICLKNLSRVSEFSLCLKPSGKFKLAQNVAQSCSQTVTVFKMLSVQVPLLFTCGLITSLVVLSFGPIISECLFPLLYFYNFVNDPTTLPFQPFADTSLLPYQYFTQ